MINAILAAYVSYMWMDADDFIRTNFKRYYREIRNQTPDGESIGFWDFEGILILWVLLAPIWRIYKLFVPECVNHDC